MGHEACYDNWAAAGNKEWACDCFKKSEDVRDDRVKHIFLSSWLGAGG
jgi:hypothetical protein